MLDDILGRYRSFLRLPDVARLLVTALITRLPIASLTLAMLMHVRALTGSFSEAGLTVGVDLAASAIAAPVLGRIIDRRGPRAVMLVTGIVCPLALLFILLADTLALSVAGLVAAAAIAGAFAPPITVLTRTVWRYRFDDPGERKTAFALDAVLIELAFTVGPMLVALLLAVASPRAAFAAAFVLVALAVPIFAWSPALKYWRHQPGVERRLLGPLADPRLLAVYAVTFLLMFSLGLLEIGYAGFATAAAMPAFAGILIAVNSIGSGAGGLLYGGTQLAMPVERQLPRLLLLVVLPLAAHAVTTLALAACGPCADRRHRHRSGADGGDAPDQRQRAVALCDRGVHLVDDLPGRRSRRRPCPGRQHRRSPRRARRVRRRRRCRDDGGDQRAGRAPAQAKAERAPTGNPGVSGSAPERGRSGAIKPAVAVKSCESACARLSGPRPSALPGRVSWPPPSRAATARSGWRHCCLRASARWS